MADRTTHGARLATALAAALERHLPPWEKLARVGFAGAELSYRLTIGLREALDLSALERAVAARYTQSDAGFVLPGRRVSLDERRLTLVVWGTSAVLPCDDGGVQNAILVALADGAPDAVAYVETERYTDTPFEEPPAKRRRGAEALAFLDELVRPTAVLQFAELEYFRDCANPCIDIVVHGSDRRTQGVRERWLPVELFVRPAGPYTLHAEARAYSFPWYHPHLHEYSRAAIWISAPLTLELHEGEVVSLRVGVLEPARTLTEAERAFFEQPEGEPCKAPPPPRHTLYLERRLVSVPAVLVSQHHLDDVVAEVAERREELWKHEEVGD